MIEKMTASQFGRYQACIKEFCANGADNACDGTPLVSGAPKKPPCVFYKNGCQQREIAECKRHISDEIKNRKRRK